MVPNSRRPAQRRRHRHFGQRPRREQRGQRRVAQHRLPPRPTGRRPRPAGGAPAARQQGRASRPNRRPDGPADAPAAGAAGCPGAAARLQVRRRLARQHLRAAQVRRRDSARGRAASAARRAAPRPAAATVSAAAAPAPAQASGQSPCDSRRTPPGSVSAPSRLHRPARSMRCQQASDSALPAAATISQHCARVIAT